MILRCSSNPVGPNYFTSLSISHLHRPRLLSSFILELGLTLLDEGLSALLLVMRVQDAKEEAALVGHRCSLTHLERLLHGTLGVACSHHRFRGNLLGHLHGSLHHGFSIGVDTAD